MRTRRSRSELAGPGGWRRGLSAVIAVGLRPCSGAIIVLVFALAKGLFWAGVAATLVMGLGTAITVAAIATIAVGARAWAGRFAGTRAGMHPAMRGIEVGAALVIIAFGVSAHRLHRERAADRSVSTPRRPREGGDPHCTPIGRAHKS